MVKQIPWGWFARFLLKCEVMGSFLALQEHIVNVGTQSMESAPHPLQNQPIDTIGIYISQMLYMYSVQCVNHRQIMDNLVFKHIFLFISKMSSPPIDYRLDPNGTKQYPRITLVADGTYVYKTIILGHCSNKGTVSIPFFLSVDNECLETNMSVMHFVIIMKKMLYFFVLSI